MEVGGVSSLFGGFLINLFLVGAESVSIRTGADLVVGYRVIAVADQNGPDVCESLQMLEASMISVELLLPRPPLFLQGLP